MLGDIKEGEKTENSAETNECSEDGNDSGLVPESPAQPPPDYVCERKQGDGEEDQGHDDKIAPPPSWLFKRKNVEHETFLPGYDKPGSVGPLGSEDKEYGLIPPANITRDLPPGKNWGIVYRNHRGVVEGTFWIVVTENQMTLSRKLEPLPCPWWWCMPERRYGNTCHTSVSTRDVYAVEGVDLWGQPEMPFQWDSPGNCLRRCVSPIKAVVGTCPYSITTLILFVETILAFYSNRGWVYILSLVTLFFSSMALNYHRKNKAYESHSNMPKSDAIAKYIRWYSKYRQYLKIATSLLVFLTVMTLIFNVMTDVEDYVRDDATDNADYIFEDVVVALVVSSLVLTLCLACIMATQQEKYQNGFQYSKMKLTGREKSGYPFEFQLETQDAIRFQDYFKLIMIKNADSEKQVKIDERRISQLV